MVTLNAGENAGESYEPFIRLFFRSLGPYWSTSLSHWASRCWNSNDCECMEMLWKVVDVLFHEGLGLMSGG
jgi:hypothetical protein